MKFGLLILATILIFSQGCYANTSKGMATIEDFSEAKTQLTGIKLPADFALLAQKDILLLLGMDNECIELDTQHNERFVLLFQLKSGDKLLALTCATGSYQDTYLTYYIKTINKQNIAYPILWKEPVFTNGEWVLNSTKMLTGSIEINRENNELKLLRLYSAFGSCGYRANYEITFPQLISIEPTTLSADNDCNNGILVEQWPAIKLKN
jgi:hypothetical protein